MLHYSSIRLFAEKAVNFSICLKLRVNETKEKETDKESKKSKPRKARKMNIVSRV